MTDTSDRPNIHDVPGLGERRAKALKIGGATDWWFYPLLLAVAVTLILISLGADVFDHDAVPQKAARDGAAYVYGADALAGGTKTADGHMLHVTRDLGISARTLRIGIRPGMGGPTPNNAGATLLLDPADAAGLTGKPVHVEITFRRIGVTTAASLGASLQTGGPISWSVAAIPAANGVMVFDLPATSSPPKGFGLWIVSDKADYNYGLEIAGVRLTPAG